MLNLYTFVPNRPDLIDIQLKSLRKNLQEDFVLNVFNNALFGYDRRRNNRNEFDRIEKVCRQLNVPVTAVEKDAGLIDYCQTFEATFDEQGFYRNGNVAHAYALCWAWEKVISRSSGVACILDFDMFLKTEANFTNFVQEADLSFVAQSKPDFNGRIYMWPGFVLMNLDRLPERSTLNWMCGRIDGVPVDVGGYTVQYLEAHPELKLRHLGMNNFPDDSHVNYQMLHIGETDLLHYRSGSNWDQQPAEFHMEKTLWVMRELGI